MTEPDLTTRLAELAAPFPPDQVGKLPRITCRPCRDARFGNCEQHQKQKCRDCQQYMTPAHMHIDYVGHADVTKRLLDVDPLWSWEPVVDPADHGFPVVVGGLWIKLTVCGISRYGFGDAQGKEGPNAVKEVIGDALRNAAMRFGVGLELWAKGDRNWSREGGAAADAETVAQGPRPIAPEPAEPPLASTGQLKELGVAFNDYGLADREARLTFASGIVGRELASSKELTVQEAKEVLGRIRAQTDPPAGDQQ